MTSALFSPIKLADLQLANRIAVSPMCQYSANDGVADDWHMTHLGMLANSGASFLVVEATHVERHGRITHGCLGLYSDACEAALQRVVAHCHRIGSAKLAVQLAHAGRKASAQRPWEGGKALSEAEDPWPTIGPSALPFGPGWHTPRVATEADMARVRTAFADAAKRALRQAGRRAAPRREPLALHRAENACGWRDPAMALDMGVVTRAGRRLDRAHHDAG